MFRTLSKTIDAQSLIEYTIVLGLIAAVLIAMTPMVKRVNQSMIQVVSDQIGNQQAADQRFNSGGYLVHSYTAVEQHTNHGTREDFGQIQYLYDDNVAIQTNALVNSGFIPTPKI
jgi:Flp pilus assembly pilin Flp